MLPYEGSPKMSKDDAIAMWIGVVMLIGTANVFGLLWLLISSIWGS